MSRLARLWRWLVTRYHLVGYREPHLDRGPVIWRTRQTLYWHRSYREAPHGR